MSDKPAPAAASEKKPAAAAEDKKGGKAGGDAHGKKAGGKAGLLTKTPVLIAAVMAVEGVALIAGFKTLGGGPKSASAGIVLDHDAAGEGRGDDAKGKAAGKDAAKDTVELPVCEIRAPNKLSGRTFLYDVSIYAVARADQGEKLKALFSARDALIKDRVRTIIAELDPDKLSGGSEPGLETLRRQVRYQLDQIVGDGMVTEVLVPRCMPFRTDY